MSFTRDLLTGLAELLAAHEVGDWNASGKYGDAQKAITIGGLPARPDTAFTLSLYGTAGPGDDVESSDSSVLVQVRMRANADPRVVDDMADDVFDVLHGLASTRLRSGVMVLLSRRTVVAPLGRDSSGRWERADSYHLDVVRPSPHRAD